MFAFASNDEGKDVTVYYSLSGSSLRTHRKTKSMEWMVIPLQTTRSGVTFSTNREGHGLFVKKKKRRRRRRGRRWEEARSIEVKGILKQRNHRLLPRLRRSKINLILFVRKVDTKSEISAWTEASVLCIGYFPSSPFPQKRPTSTNIPHPIPASIYRVLSGNTV